MTFLARRRVFSNGAPGVARLARAAVVALVPVFACGCEYTATIRNESDKTVLAELEHDRFLADTLTKRSAMLEPGDEAVLGPFKVDPLEPITLRIRIVGDVFGARQSERLEPGSSTYVIENGNLESWESVLIRRESN